MRITSSLELIETTPFTKDKWTRPDSLGWGQSNIIQRGKYIEKGGVNVTELEIPLAEHSFYAVGVSLVIHPWNPHVPTIHLNYRYIEILLSNEVVDWWVAGGSDLTPYYINRDDTVLFHSALKESCDAFDIEFYPRYKRECDNYFWIKHRNFARGLGGIFFDDLTSLDSGKALEFIDSCGRAFIRSYPEILNRRKDQEFSKEQRKWQKIKRGHYVEFNLCYDRGTSVGLMTPDANIEAIFMSIPLNASWEYKHCPQPGSPEEELLEILKNPIDWVN